jgi:hypothetical protein
MSVRNGIVLLLALSTLSLLVGCGSTPSANAPPSGAFNNNSLSGTYVFSISGADITAANDGINTTGSFFAMVGTLTASNGGLTGTIDIVDPSLALVAAGATGTVNPVQTGLAATGGYSITSDGRGSGTISFPINGQTEQFGIDFVLSSSSDGQITRFDANGTGSGTFEQQGSVTQSGLGSYAFSLSGVDLDTNPFGAVGEFAVSGNAITGLYDINDARNSSGLTGNALTGSVTLASSSGAGTAQLITGTSYGTLSFDVWPIDATHLKFIETDGVEYTAGDAFTQQTSIPAGQFVYTMSGLDGDALLASGGVLTYDGSLNISNGFEAMNDGNLTTIDQSTTVSGTLTTTGTSGRYQLSLAGFFNGNEGAVTTNNFAAYPSASGILLLEIDGGGVTAGTALQQTATTFAASQGYGLNLTGENVSDGAAEGFEVDDIAEFTANSGGTLSNGLIDENDEGTLEFDQQLGSGGTYNSAGTGYGAIMYPATNLTAIGTLNLAYFVANSSTVIFIETDAGGQTGVGALQTQSAPGASSALAHTMSHFASLRATSFIRAHQKKKK